MDTATHRRKSRLRLGSSGSELDASRSLPDEGADSSGREGLEMNRQLGVVMLMRKFYPLTGGYQNQSLRLAQEMMRRNIRVYVVTQRHQTLQPYEVYQRVPIHRVFAFPTGHLAAVSYLLFSFLWMFKNRRKFQIIHANRSSSGLIAGLIGYLLRKRVLYKLTRGDEIDVKGFRTTLLGRIKVYCLKHVVERFVAITGEIEQDLQHIGIPPRKVVRIPNGITLDSPQTHDRNRVKSELGWPEETKIVTFVGRLVHAKGVDWLLDIWKVVAPQDRLARLLIVGDGPERAALEDQLRSLEIAQTATFIGRQDNVYKFLAITDVFVLPSRQEGNSNALLEAMSQALPAVVADDLLSGNREIVDHGRDGYVIKLGDSAAFAHALLKLLKEPQLRREMGRNARRKVQEKFSMRLVADRYCRIYSELTQDSAS